MAKKRLILCLLLDGDIFVNSRNFSLSHVGNIETILQYLNFEAMDEVVLLNVDRQEKNISEFSKRLREFGRHCFVPMCVGGGIKSLADIDSLLRSGADKVVINTSAIENPQFINEASNRYGSQCVVVSIDAKKVDGEYKVHINNGVNNTSIDVIEWAKKIETLGAGEIFLTSIDHDGVCQGYDLELVSSVSKSVDIPVIASGGVGVFEHLVDGIKDGNADAVSAANIFHFIGEGLVKAKEHLRNEGLDFPKPIWNF